MTFNTCFRLCKQGTAIWTKLQNYSISKYKLREVPDSNHDRKTYHNQVFQGFSQSLPFKLATTTLLNAVHTIHLAHTTASFDATVYINTIVKQTTT